MTDRIDQEQTEDGHYDDLQKIRTSLGHRECRQVNVEIHFL